MRLLKTLPHSIKWLVFVFASLFCVACQSNYTYVEVSNDSSKNASKKIDAENDIDAYSKGYEIFIASIKSSKDFAKGDEPNSIGSSGFEVLNSNKENIIYKIDLRIKDSIEKHLDEKLGYTRINNNEVLQDNETKNITAGEEAYPVKILSARPVYREYSSFNDIHLAWKNVSEKTISIIKFRWTGINNNDEPAVMGEGGGFSENRLKPGESLSGEWTILSKGLKKITKVWVEEVVFEDGSKWKLSSK